MELPLSRCALSKKKKSSGAKRQKSIRAPGARNSSSSCRYFLCRQLLRASREKDLEVGTGKGEKQKH
ncbi:unnamed protein product [Lactuca virosa]|uniref:Uncharacterized protein n=1 Tax=Lactuca virosa TaxID=75947 RepID=A0AAU9LJT9_9ASTR|nr:unnamed protein product [Lactuca virosa]